MANVDNIAELHEEVLELFLEYRKENGSDLTFLLRPPNNSSNKGYLTKGRWFMGDKNKLTTFFVFNPSLYSSNYKYNHELRLDIYFSKDIALNFDFLYYHFDDSFKSFTKELIQKLDEIPFDGTVYYTNNNNFKKRFIKLIELIDNLLKKEEIQDSKNHTIIPQQNFQTNLAYIQQKRQEIKEKRKREFPNNIPNPNGKPIKVSLRSFTIKNYYAIKSTNIQNLSKEAPWIFLTGENGAGKSLVLQALAIGLYGNREEVIIPKEKKTAIEVTYQSQGNKLYHNNIKKLKTFTSLPYLACFGPTRLDVQIEGSENKSAKRSTATYGLFGNYDALFKNIETELKFAYYENKGKYNALVEMLKKVIPSLEKVDFDRRNRSIQYYEKNIRKNGVVYQAVSFSELATGIKSIIAIVGDIYLRFSMLRQKETNTEEYLLPEDLYGIVIIDELDLHLHPRWQKELPTLLSTVFPHIQFIASTHSAIPILGAPKESVFLTVNRDTKKGITVEKVDLDVANLTPNLILSSQIFNYQDITAKTNTSKEAIRTEDTMLEKKYRDDLKNRLLKFAKETDGDLKKFIKN